MMAATTPFQSSTVDACSQRATKRDNAHQRHTRSVQSSSCAEGSFFSSQAQFVSVHDLQPKRVVLQRYRSHPLTSRCCSILSAIRTATRCNSTCHQIDAYPVQLRHAVHRPSGPNDHHRAPRARIHLDPPGSTFRPVVSTTWHSPPCSPSRLSGLHRPSRLRPRVLWCIAVFQGSSTRSVFLRRGVLSSDRSRCCLYSPCSVRIASLHGFLRPEPFHVQAPHSP